MLKYISHLLLFFLTLTSYNGSAQLSPVWVNGIGESKGNTEGFDVAYDASGNMYSIGTFTGLKVDFDPSAGVSYLESTNALLDVFVAKYNSSGTLQWAFPIGGTGYDYGYGIAVSGNDVYVTGFVNGTAAIDMDPSTNTNTVTVVGNNDVFVAKYDGSLIPSSTSFYQWAFVLGGTGNDQGNDILISGNDLYITGTINGTSALDMDPSTNTNTITGAGNDESFVVKYDASLTPSNTSFYQWAFRVGNFGVDYGIGLAISGNDLYLAGRTSGTTDMDPSTNVNNVSAPGSLYGYIAKYDASLTPSNTSFYKWSFGYNGTYQSWITDIDVSGTDVYLIGMIHGSGGAVDMDPSTNTNSLTPLATNTDVVVAKYDGSLTPSNTSFYKWAFSMGGTVGDAGNGIAVSGNDVYITGAIRNTATLDFDPSTNTNNLTFAGSDDIFVAKYNGSLTPSNTSFYQWAFPLGGLGSDSGNKIAATASNVIVTGDFTAATVDFDPGAGTDNLTSYIQNGFVASYTNAGAHNTALRMGGSGSNDNGNAVAVDASGNSYVTGSFNGAVDFDPGVGENILFSNGLLDNYLAKFNSSGELVWVFSLGGTGSESIVDMALSGNDIYITGESYSNSTFDMDPSTNTNNLALLSSDRFIAKYDVSFSPTSTSFYQWAFAYGSGSFNERFKIAVSGSDLYVTGDFESTVDMDPSTNTNNISATADFDVFVTKYDGSLTPSNSSFYQWAFPLGSTDENFPRDIIISGSDLYVTGGMAGTTDMDPSTNVNNIVAGSSLDIFLAKYDASLSPSNTSFYKWSFSAGNTGGNFGGGIITSGSDVYLTGNFQGNPDMDPSTNTNTVTSAGAYDVFVAKYDGSLVPSNTSFHVWSCSFGGTGNDFGNSVALLNEQLFISGYINGTTAIDVDPSTNSNTLTGAGGNDIFVVNYDANLSPSNTSFYNYAFVAGGPGNDVSNAVIIDGNSDLLVVGDYNSIDADFDPEAGTLLHSSLDNNIFIGKYLSSRPLPVTLLSFDARPINNDYALLDWQTANEINNDYFTIERSEDLTKFEAIGTVPGYGNSNVIRNYNFVDPLDGYAVKPNILYYRLKQTDFNGDSTYSEIRPVTFKNGISIIRAYPNPSEGFYYFDVYSSVDQVANYEIIDAKGAVVYRKNLDLTKGAQKFTIDLTELSTGIYLLGISSEDHQYQDKIRLGLH